MANAPEPESRSTRSRQSGSGDFLPKRGRPETVRSKIAAVHAEHPDWPSKLIAQHLGVSEDAVRATASRNGLKLVSWWDYERALKAQTRRALEAATAEPQEAVETPPAPKAQPEPEQPPAVIPAAPKPVIVTAPTEPRRVVPTHAPVGAGPSTRFYVRDQKGRYLHQSLERSPTDTGPLMTTNRKWAWFDNAQRFAGACRKWPEIADMRKELPNA